MKASSILALLCAMGATLFAAEEKSATPATVTHRITGLFDRGREADLRATMEKLPGIDVVSIDFDHAEATFRYEAKAVFPGTKPEDLLKRFDEKLRQASVNTFGVKPLCATPRDRLARIEIPVVGLDCRACSLAAYEAVAKLEGVAQATASFRDGKVCALIDPAQTDRAKLEAALKEKRVELKQP
jgi:copper chaperone CopZ